jgi:iron-sulfur cluster insertion protein
LHGGANEDVLNMLDEIGEVKNVRAYIENRLKNKAVIWGLGGGCSGFSYGFTFDDKQKEGDSGVAKNGVQLVVDPMSYQYLIGATADYLEDLQGSRFIIHNPNAKTTCGCGSSFSV